MAFHTEKQIETWLQHATREVVLADGSRRHVTAMNLTWSKAESLVTLDGYTLAELASLAAGEARLQRLHFDEAFACVVVYLDNKRRDRWGI
jgi:hypothetical protein